MSHPKSLLMQNSPKPPDGASILLGHETLMMSPEPRGAVRLPLSSLARHVHITGTTGSGKSTTAKAICGGLLENGIPTLILDRTGEYAERFAGAERVVILKPGENLSIALFGLEEVDLEAQIVGWLSLMNHFYWVSYGQELPPLQSRVLRETLFNAYHGSKGTITISGLIEDLESRSARSGDKGGWTESIEAAISRLWPLTISKVGATFNRSYSTLRVAQLFEHNLTIIDLSVLPDDSARNLLSQIILKQVYEEARKNGKSKEDVISLAFLIDEAHHVCPNRRDYISIPERCAIELRKYGFSLITCATRPILVSPNIIANSNTLISHMLNNSDDIETAAGFFLGGTSVKESLRRLPVGEAMVQINSPRPLSPIRCKVEPYRGSLTR